MQHQRLQCAIAALACFTTWATPAEAQVSDWIRKVLPSDAASAPQEGRANDAAVAQAGPVKPSKDVESELAPDVQCKRPRERFNMSEKLSDYGGTVATLRLQRLVSSDFKYADLTPEDRQMLRYLAQTTMWIPPEIEVKLAESSTLTSNIFGKREDNTLSELDSLALQEIEQRLVRLRGVMSEYPSEIRLKFDKKLPDGAFARLGGTIEISERFLNGLTAAGTGADFLLAHEVSHVYKRHVLKDIQFKLISTAEGWDLAKKVIQRAMRGLQVNVVSDSVFVFRTVPQLVEFVRGVQLQFNREQELEADACSTIWLKAVETDPIDAWEKYQQTLGANTSYSKDHPSTEERELRFRRKAAGKDLGPDTKGTNKGTVTKEGTKIINQNPKKQ